MKFRTRFSGILDPCFAASRRSLLLAGASLILGAQAAIAATPAAPAQRPNIVFIMADNLGWGELGVYGGGALRGAPTPRLDAFAAQGMRLQNFNVEVSCAPSRAALMTGRFGIRTGNNRSGETGKRHGLVRWEVTTGQLLSQQGYATALYGKWDLGDEQGRYPNDRGFDEWYGIPRSSNEAMNRQSPGYDPAVTQLEYVLEGRKGEETRQVKEFDIAARREIDTELTRRAVGFIKRQSAAKRPFYAYVPLTQVHYPTLPSRAFDGRTGNGSFADAVVETDHHVGEILDAIDKAGVAGNTIVVFCSDNGAESRRPWQGSSGVWSGYYRSAREGSLRAPFLIRWPGRIAPGVNNEIVHIVDIAPTLARVAGAAMPTDRPVDGVDQLDFFLGQKAKSNREGFPIFQRGELTAVKWRNWKYYVVLQENADTPTVRPDKPLLYNVLWDPKEETPRNTELEDAWVLPKLREMLDEAKASLVAYPPIAAGAADPYMPPWTKPAP